MNNNDNGNWNQSSSSNNNGGNSNSNDQWGSNEGWGQSNDGGWMAFSKGEQPFVAKGWGGGSASEGQQNEQQMGQNGAETGSTGPVIATVKEESGKQAQSAEPEQHVQQV